VVEVNGNQFFGNTLQDAFEGPLRFFEDFINLVLGYILAKRADQITSETLGVGTRMASPSSFPSIRDDLCDRPAARWVGIMDRAAARPALVLVKRIEDSLVHV